MSNQTSLFVRRFASHCAALLLLIQGVAVADSPAAKARWIVARTMPAAEAVQAAAADAKLVFAISSTHVAKYERSSGERLAVSSGEAKHLNSGFLWQGRLYCAHSNYPQTPERSEIKALDVELMRLSTFKDFGNFGGSLTWVLREGDHWWCNFARYGADNAATFLVKFDADWNEVGRWTYPPELIARLGRYSLSGGIWRDGELLVTGHDDPIMFRLRLPTQGAVLQFAQAESIPFTGQGIAADQATGGLVGIHRAKRQVVFASLQNEPRPLLRILSYNIHHGEGVDGQLDLARIAKVIRAAEPDLVALQEVDQKATRSKAVDQPAELARLTGMRVAFGDNIPLQGGKYGNAVLSRFAIKSHRNHMLPNLDNGEQRGVLELEIEIPGSEQPLLLLATHFDHRRMDAERVASAKAINELAAKRANRPAVFAGDLNDVPDSPMMAELAKHWTRTNEHPLPTIPVARPSRQIDFILFRPSDRWQVVETRVIDEAVASDHRPILAVLELKPEAQSK